MNQIISSENAIEVLNLTKYYDKLLAVDHINFKIKKGEIFVFLDPNGADKTTMIHLLTHNTFFDTFKKFQRAFIKFIRNFKLSSLIIKTRYSFAKLIPSL